MPTILSQLQLFRESFDGNLQNDTRTGKIMIDKQFPPRYSLFFPMKKLPTA